MVCISMIVSGCILLYFFKQKTANEMRISNWSSDVCSSDLYGGMKAAAPQEPAYADGEDPAVRNLERLFVILQRESTPRAFYFARNGQRRYVDHRYFFGKLRAAPEIGRASCRARVCQYV